MRCLLIVHALLERLLSLPLLARDIAAFSSSTSLSVVMLSSILIASSAASTGTSCPSSNGTIYTSTEGHTYEITCNSDYRGNDLPEIDGWSLASCIASCDSVPRCRAVVWNMLGDSCLLKYAFGTPTYLSGRVADAAKRVTISTSSALSTDSALVKSSIASTSSTDSTLIESSSSSASSTDSALLKSSTGTSALRTSELPSATSKAASNPDGNQLNTASEIGSIVAAIFGALGVGVAIFFGVKEVKKRRAAHSSTPSQVPSDTLESPGTSDPSTQNPMVRQQVSEPHVLPAPYPHNAPSELPSPMPPAS